MNIAEKLTTVAENEPKVYEAGQKDKFEQFWEMYQHNGTRTDCESMFRNWLMLSSNNGDDWFYPVYDFNAASASYMFSRFSYGNYIFDLDARLKQCGVVLNTSDSTYATNMFYAAWVDNIPPLDLRKCGSLNSTFNGCRATTIQKIIVSENTTYGNAFTNASYLTHVRFEGAIGRTINFGDCPLYSLSILGDYATEEQIANGKNLYRFGENYYFGGIMGALMDEPTAANQTITFKKSVVDEHFGGEEGAMWIALVGSKPNWNFATK